MIELAATATAWSPRHYALKYRTSLATGAAIAVAVVSITDMVLVCESSIDIAPLHWQLSVHLEQTAFRYQDCLRIQCVQASPEDVSF